MCLPGCRSACSPLDSPDTILAIIITTVYATDVLLNFFVAYYDEGELVTSLSKIAREQLHVRNELELLMYAATLTWHALCAYVL